MNAAPHVCFDRILPRDLMRPLRSTTGPDGTERAVSPRGKKWANGSTLRVRFMNGSQADRSRTVEQAQWWSAVANLDFDFSGAPDADIRITFDPNDGAWSTVGTDARQVPFNQATMNLGFLDGGTAAHEFGHAIGLGHEHSNPAGGLQWNEPVVLRALAGPPNFWDEATVRHNVFRKYSLDQINGTEFDPRSIMLYAFPASWTLNGVGTEANEVLSTLDKEFVAGALMYPRGGAGPSQATRLTVGGDRVKASIGAPGEEDLFAFEAEEDGVYEVTTRGQTDIYMKLFGPNSETALIDEDDDSGYGLNPRIAAPLVAGRYLVQIRHYERSSGTGEYAIAVRRR